MATQVTLNSGAVSSAGSLKLQTNGTTDAVTIDTSQNVGIGTSSPDAKLTVNGQFSVGSQTTGQRTYMGTNGTYNYIQSLSSTSTAVGLAFYNGGSQNMTLDASGNLGVGTTSPSGKLHVSAADANQFFIERTAGVTGKFRFAVAANNNTLFITDVAQNADRLVIDSSGNLLVGTTSGPVTARGTFNYPGNTTIGLVMQDTTAAGGTAIRFYTNSTGFVGSITTSSSATAYNTSSDYRLKENIAPMTGALSVISQLKPVTYKWKVDGSDGQGFIAHELQAVVPDCVTGEKDAVDADGNPVYQGIDTSFLVATLTAAIQEQQALITQLQAQLTSVSADVAALKG